MPTLVRLISACTVFVGLIAFTPASPVSAAGVVGTGTAASCTEAALDAALAGGGLVTFNCGAGATTIPLSSEKIITVDTQVNGNGSITLDGQNQSRHFWVADNTSLNISGLTLTGGNGAGASDDGRGGSLFTMFGTINIHDSTISNNSAAISGGAIRVVSGTVTITDSVINSNTALRGGAIRSSSVGTVTITNSTLNGNAATETDGGAIHESTGFVTIMSSTLSGNSAAGEGGAIRSGRSLTIHDSTVSGNIAFQGGGIRASGANVSITASEIVDNVGENLGGGLSASNGVVTIETTTISGNTTSGTGGGANLSGGTVSLLQSTISGNNATSGGGITRFAGTMEIENSTVSGNTAATSGGGIWAAASAMVDISSSTIVDNGAGDGGGLLGSGVTIRLDHSIIADNPAGGNCAGSTISSLDYNLSDDATCNLAQGNDLPNTPPGVTALGDFGGPTQTHHPLESSAAIDSSTCAVAADQRGVSRPQNVDCDRGSVEARESVELTELCASYYTGAVSVAAGGQCGAGQMLLSLPSPWSLTFCLNPYTGQLTLAFRGDCTPPRTAHVYPDDGPLTLCWSLYTGRLRAATDPAYCSLLGEVPARLPLAP